MYTVLHIFRPVLFGAGNHGNHQNFNTSLLSYILIDFHFLKKSIQNGRFKKTEIFQLPKFSIFFVKFSWIGLGLVG